jgi:hypothetical protein
MISAKEGQIHDTDSPSEGKVLPDDSIKGYSVTPCESLCASQAHGSAIRA